MEGIDGRYHLPVVSVPVVHSMAETEKSLPQKVNPATKCYPVTSIWGSWQTYTNIHVNTS